MADEDANIICGMVYDKDAGDEIRVTVVATGLNGEQPRVASVPNTTEALNVSRMPSRPAMATTQTALNPKTQAMQAPLFGNEQAYDEDELAVPAFLRYQAD
jgi:cell division protein FtsZ